MAGAIKGLTVEIGGRTDQLRSALRGVTSDATRLQQELRAVDKELRFNPGNTVLIEQKFQALSEKSAVLREKLAVLTAAQKQNYEAWQRYAAVKDELEPLNRQVKETSDRMAVLTKKAKEAEAAFNSGKGTEEAYKKAEKAMKECEDELERLVARQKELSKDTVSDEQYRELNREIEKTKNQIKACETQMVQFGSVTAAQLEAAGAKVTEFGTKLQGAASATSGLSMASAMVGAGIIGMSEDFEKSMSKVQALSGATGTELDELKDKARDMGSTTVYTAGEAADAMGYMALAGWKTDEMLEGIEPILNLATAGNMDLAEASDIVTDYLTAFGLSAKDSATFVDQLAYAQANSNTTVEQLGEAFKNCAAAGGSLGYTTADVTSALMVMANAGVKGSDAGTALKSIMVRLASDTSGCATALHEYGVEIYDSEGNMRDLSSILVDIGQVMNGLTDEQSANLSKVIAGTYQYSRFQTIMSGFGQNMKDVGKDYETYNQRLQDCGGTAEEMADIMQDNLWGALKHLQSVLSESALQIGEQMTPTIEDVCDVITRAADEFNSLSPEVKKAAGEALALGAALSPVLAAGAAANKVLGGLLTTTGRAMSTVKGALGLVEGVPGVFQRITGALGKVVPALNKTETAAKSAAKGTEALGTASKAASTATNLLANIGLMAVIAVIGVLIAKYEEYKAHMDLVEGATDGLKDATDGLTGSLGNTSQDAEKGATGVDKYRKALDSAKTSAEDALEANRNLAQNMRDLTVRYQASNTMIGDYRDTIVEVCERNRELADGEELAAGDKARLEAAVEGLNDELGTEYDAQQLLAGAYGESGDAIDGMIGDLDRYIQTVQMQAKLDAERAALTDAYTAQAEADTALREATEAQAEAQEHLNNVMRESQDSTNPYMVEYYAEQIREAQSGVDSATDSVNDAQDALDAANDSIQTTKDDIDQTTQAMNGASDALTTLRQYLSVSGYTMDEFGDACEDAGVSIDELATLSSQQLTEMVQDFDGTGASITQSLQQLGIDVGEYAGAALDAYKANLDDGRLTTESTAAEVQAAIQDSMTGIHAACDDAGIGFDKLSTIGDDKLQALMQSCDGHKESLYKALDQMGIYVPGKCEEAIDAYCQAISDGAIEADYSAEQVRAAVLAKLDGASSAARQGSDTSKGYARGVASGVEQTESAAGSLASAVDAADRSGESYDWGCHLAQNLAEGIRNKRDEVKNASLSIADVVRRVFGHSIAKEGPLHVGGKGEAEWGRHLVQNFAEGMLSSAGLLDEASDALAERAVSGLSDLGGGLFDQTAASSAVSAVQELQVRSDYARDERRAYDGENVVDAVQELGDRIDGLQLVLDTGALAGGLTDKIDRSLGSKRRRKEGALC